MPKGAVVSNKKRFDQDFSPIEGLENESKKTSNKPDDFKHLFSNNTDDHFRIGLTIAKKSVKLYSPFADSDVIVASPLGLKTIIDSDEEDKELDIQNITASIEMLVIDRAEFLLMQNWKNVQLVVSQLNQRPTISKFPNPARIRLAHLAGLGKHYRQSLVFSSIDSPFIELLTACFSNFEGLAYFPYVPSFPKNMTTFIPHWIHSTQESFTEPTMNLKTIPFFVKEAKSSKDLEIVKNDTFPSEDSFGNHIVTTYENIHSNQDYNNLKGSAIPSARVAAFRQRILPRLIRGNDKRVLIYVPDFYDAEILKMMLQKEGLEFCYINEYSSDIEGDRFRSLFGDGKIRILMITERYYFYKRRRIVGAMNFIFLGPPSFPWFGTELINTGFFKNAQKPRENEVDFNEPDTKRKRIEPAEQPLKPQYNVTVLYFSPLESTLISSFLGSASTAQAL
ncbi:hypothetical protein Ciccas_001258 [Cichlidogyrus casuarinus]|uniref:U3 small nucleolar RNA-associated protein 25 n=1 Tax=Cichlidogyrus casuarinus TaxID=1844966 RepID=A0ABD2QKK4_9PLAT